MLQIRIIVVSVALYVGTMPSTLGSLSNMQTFNLFYTSVNGRLLSYQIQACMWCVIAM